MGEITSEQMILWIKKEREFAIKSLEYRASKKGYPRSFVENQTRRWDIVIDAVKEFAEKYMQPTTTEGGLYGKE